VNPKERQQLNTPITKKLPKALGKLANGKLLGIDGLSPKFYKIFWDLLKTSYLEMLNTSYNKGCFPLTTRTSIITLIYKK
jgi:hypothetical protein